MASENAGFPTAVLPIASNPQTGATADTTARSPLSDPHPCLIIFPATPFKPHPASHFMRHIKVQTVRQTTIISLMKADKIEDSAVIRHDCPEISQAMSGN